MLASPEKNGFFILFKVLIKRFFILLEFKKLINEIDDMTISIIYTL